jgi:hypothetical protein
VGGDGGWVLVGPGSEWFWSMVGNVVLVVTLVGLYLQLRADRATRTFAQAQALEEAWSRRPFQVQRLQALIALDGRPVEDGMPHEATAVMAWFDRLGMMVRKGYIHQGDVADSFDEVMLWWWSITRPYLERDRERYGAPAHLADLDLLAARFATAWQRDFGRPYEPVGGIAERIDALDSGLRFERDIENGVFPQRNPEVPTRAGG